SAHRSQPGAGQGRRVPMLLFERRRDQHRRDQPVPLAARTHIRLASVPARFRLRGGNGPERAQRVLPAGRFRPAPSTGESLLRNIGSTWVVTLVTIAATYVLTPFVIHSLGP